MVLEEAARILIDQINFNKPKDFLAQTSDENFSFNEWLKSSAASDECFN